MSIVVPALITSVRAPPSRVNVSAGPSTFVQSAPHHNGLFCAGVKCTDWAGLRFTSSAWAADAMSGDASATAAVPATVAVRRRRRDPVVLLMDAPGRE